MNKNAKLTVYADHTRNKIDQQKYFWTFYGTFCRCDLWKRICTGT